MEEHRDLILAALRYLDAKPSEREVRMAPAEFMEVTGFPEENWPGPLMELQPFMGWFIGSRDVSLNPKWADDFRARVTPRPQRASLGDDEAVRIVADAVARRIERDQEFTVEGIAAETGVPDYHADRIVHEFVDGEILSIFHGREFQWGRRSRAQLLAIARPLRDDVLDLQPATPQHVLPGYERLPEPVQRIYWETMMAFAHRFDTLVAIGLRAVVEATCRNRSVSGGNLKQKIDALAGATPSLADDVLHALRDRGNEGAHEAQPLPEAERVAALTAVHHLLTAVYMLPAASATLRRS